MHLINLAFLVQAAGVLFSLTNAAPAESNELLVIEVKCQIKSLDDMGPCTASPRDLNPMKHNSWLDTEGLVPKGTKKKHGHYILPKNFSIIAVHKVLNEWQRETNLGQKTVPFLRLFADSEVHEDQETDTMSDETGDVDVDAVAPSIGKRMPVLPIREDDMIERMSFFSS